jgi:hypothetical protein
LPGVRTEITEIVTALGMTDHDDIAGALEARPQLVLNVSPTHWDRLDDTFAAGGYAAEFAASWANGRAFLESADGLRGRIPIVIEWKGPHHQPGYDVIPADLRIDHVFLVSCKYQSRILTNSSPSNLFLRRLADRSGNRDNVSWYATVAPDHLEHLYSCIRRFVGQELLPASSDDLTLFQKKRIRTSCSDVWPPLLAPVWDEFSLAVANASAEVWRQQLSSPARRREMLWRLLRLGPAPYFVLGSTSHGAVRIRIGTPWDWMQNFALQDLEIDGIPAGQPRVAWRATVSDIGADTICEVAGHVEVRWAHGRFSAVEAKIYLDSDVADIPGYFPLPE